MEPTRPSLLIRVRNATDTQAWEEFYNLYSPLLYSYARDQRLSHEDAEDIRSSCYESIVKNIQRFQYDGQKRGFRAWLRTMVNRRIIDQKRKKRIPIAKMVDVQQIKGTERSVDEIFDEHWQLHHLRYAIGNVQKRVSETTFEAFLLLTEADLSVGEVCQRMDMNADQVYRIRSRVLSLIREEMSQFDVDIQ